ncbi:beta-flanking protein [Kwoniella heveanensis CBS 569]|uniref:Beta-flanking protein n=1 Tax=Kwoniella heveanensis BCC8398 TaxID=1296120 RepID=A0A1B9GNP7_9TREE|nr:beta-flanking protein [Kwoniella heveanensis BCC8398]OCF45902.1 beta-flanking protein [Kwoniella heveanensis CBS 569]
MDFIKKMAEEKLGGMGNDNQNQNQGQGYNQNQGQGYSQQNAGGYGGNQGGYEGNQGGYGGNQGGYGGEQQQQNYGGNQGGFGGGNFSGGGEQYNAPHGSGGAGYGGNQGGFSGGFPTINENTAVSAANAHAANGDDNSSLFSTAMSFLGGMNKDDNDVDEQKVQQEHQQAYGQGNAGSMSANAIGAAAAMQALKSFTSGDSKAASSGGGDMQSKIIGMAMSEAAKLFDQSGGAASGNKQDAVTSAGQVILKLLLKSQFSGTTGGGNSGGLSGLMSMASKFM